MGFGPSSVKITETIKEDSSRSTLQIYLEEYEELLSAERLHNNVLRLIPCGRRDILSKKIFSYRNSVRGVETFSSDTPEQKPISMNKPFEVDSHREKLDLELAHYEICRLESTLDSIVEYCKSLPKWKMFLLHLLVPFIYDSLIPTRDEIVSHTPQEHPVKE